MTANPWEDFARRGRELYEQQAEVAQHLARRAEQAREHLAATPGQEKALAPMPRPWPSCGARG